MFDSDGPCASLAITCLKVGTEEGLKQRLHELQEGDQDSVHQWPLWGHSLFTSATIFLFPRSLIDFWGWERLAVVSRMGYTFLNSTEVTVKTFSTLATLYSLQP